MQKYYKSNVAFSQRILYPFKHLSTFIHLYKKKLDFHLTFMSLLDKGCKSMVVFLYRSLTVHWGIPQSVTKRKIRNRVYTQWKSRALEWYSNKLIHFAFITLGTDRKYTDLDFILKLESQSKSQSVIYLIHVLKRQWHTYVKIGTLFWG